MKLLFTALLASKSKVKAQCIKVFRQHIFGIVKTCKNFGDKEVSQKAQYTATQTHNVCHATYN